MVLTSKAKSRLPLTFCSRPGFVRGEAHIPPSPALLSREPPRSLPPQPPQICCVPSSLGPAEWSRDSPPFRLGQSELLLGYWS